MYDYVLKNGLVVDGTRNSPFNGSICIKNGKIAHITEESNVSGKEIINCEGKIISPGFIDLHTHSDACPLNTTKAESMLYQGVTFQIGGNCGISLIPSNKEMEKEIRSFFIRNVEITIEDETLELNDMNDYLNIANQKEYAINSGLLVGHGTLRAAIMGFDDRKASDDEMEQMKKLLDSEMKSGAFGMSLGLIYPPSSYGDVNEFVELSKVIKDNNGILATHMRDEGDKVFDSVDEMIEVAERSGVHLHISHLKLMGKPQWGRSQELLAHIESARKRGCTITCDQYPYEATATGLTALVPGWALDGGNAKMLDRLEQKEERLKEDIANIMDKRGGPNRIIVASTYGHLTNLDGKNIEEISEVLGLSPVDTVIEVLIKCRGEVAAIYFSLNMEDILNIMKSMDIAVGSDGVDFNYNLEYNPHPRNFGTFPRFLQTVRENDLMPIEDAVYKMTGLPAEIIHLPDRGVLKPGNIADITVFDYELVSDLSTFEKSTVKPEGIDHVFVTGLPVLVNGEQTENMAGKTIKKTE